MRIASAAMALLMLAFTGSTPVMACQPQHYSNYAFDLDDGLHVFAMKFYDDDTFEYPVAGVYRKGPGKELVWDYSGIISELPPHDRLSTDGRYFVATNFLFLDDTVPAETEALSIYDNGQLIRVYTRADFVDTETLDQYFLDAYVNREDGMRCEPGRWGWMEYDKLQNQVKVRIVRQRTVVIDVPTAEILYVDEY